MFALLYRIPELCARKMVNGNAKSIMIYRDIKVTRILVAINRCKTWRNFVR